MVTTNATLHSDQFTDLVIESDKHITQFLLLQALK